MYKVKSNRLPMLFGDYQMNGGDADMKLCSQVLHKNLAMISAKSIIHRTLGFFIEFTDLFYLFLSKLRRAVLLPDTRTPFLYHVFEVLGIGPKPKVGRIDTSRIVAFMKNAHSFWDTTIVQLPRQTMGSDKSDVPTSKTDSTVSMNVRGGSPQPARSRFSNLCPKSICEGDNRTILFTVFDMLLHFLRPRDSFIPRNFQFHLGDGFSRTMRAFFHFATLSTILILLLGTLLTEAQNNNLAANIATANNLTVIQTNTAGYFIGNGGGLTNIPTSGITTNQLQSATNNALATATNSFMPIGAAIPTTNGFVTASITNGLATTNFTLTTATNVALAELAANPSNWVTASITNGLGGGGSGIAVQGGAGTNTFLQNPTGQILATNVSVVPSGVLVTGGDWSILDGSYVLLGTNGGLVWLTNSANCHSILMSYPAMGKGWGFYTNDPGSDCPYTAGWNTPYYTTNSNITGPYFGTNPPTVALSGAVTNTTITTNAIVFNQTFSSVDTNLFFQRDGMVSYYTILIASWTAPYTMWVTIGAANITAAPDFIGTEQVYPVYQYTDGYGEVLTGDTASGTYGGLVNYYVTASVHAMYLPPQRIYVLGGTTVTWSVYITAYNPGDAFHYAASVSIHP